MSLTFILRVFICLSSFNLFIFDALDVSKRFLEIKNDLPYGALPVLYIDNVQLAQSNAICRYIGKLTDMYPTAPFQAALCDEVMDTVEEITMHIGATITLEDVEKKQRRIKLVTELLPPYFRGLEKRLKDAGGNFYSNQRLGIADLKAGDLVNWLRSGVLDHIPTDFVENIAPSMAALSERVKNDPRIKSYYAQRSKISTKS